MKNESAADASMILLINDNAYTFYDGDDNSDSIFELSVTIFDFLTYNGYSRPKQKTPNIGLNPSRTQRCPFLS